MLTQTLRPPDADDDRSDAADHETLVIMQYEELESLECIYGDSFKTVYSKRPSYTKCALHHPHKCPHTPADVPHNYIHKHNSGG
jgi:hypothetical protein